MNGFVVVESVDPSQFELALRPWELMARPKSGDAFRHRVAMLGGPDFIIYREAFSSPLSTVGLSPGGMLAIAVPLSQDNSVEYWGQTHRRTSCPLTLPGPLEVTWGHTHAQIVALLGLESLRKSLPERELEYLYLNARERRAHCHPATRGAFSFALDDTLTICENQPDLALNAGFLTGTYDKLVNWISLILRESSEEGSMPRESVRSRALRRAIEYLREYPAYNPIMTELCDAAAASERTLQYAFRDALDQTPRQFMMRRRLHAVRRALLMTEPKSNSVGKIALQHGFYELGRFSGIYRHYFGEKPSKTIAMKI